MKHILFFIASVFSIQSFSQLQLSDQSEIAIITCGPAQTELYSAFGHSAIRVYDPLLGIDAAYNYGLFSFDQPYFYLNFARGSSFYILGVQSYPDFRYTYMYYNRSIHEQVLNLSLEQKQKIFDFLQWNAKTENRSYRYDYFYDNCATRVRDVFDQQLGGEIKFDSSFITTDYTIRHLTDIYLGQQPWGDLGIDICLGLPMDKKASAFEYMFLPDYVEASFDHATINGAALVKSKSIVYEAKPSPVKGPPHPWIVLGSLFLLVAGVSYFDWKRKRVARWLDIIMFTVTGLIGVVLLLLWVATDHKAAAYNFNLLWALPSHLLVLALLKKTPPAWISRYFSVVFILSGLLLVTWLLLPQKLNLFLIPVVIAILVRAFLISRLTPGAGVKL